MAWVATHGQDSRAIVAQKAAKVAPSALFRRLRAVRDMTVVVTAWAASWAVVLLLAKGLWDIL
ncbi:MAG: hypothetical protein ACHQF3_08940 [Alphaproteobacteria bacterium]